jgi:type VI secretion system protein ImpL
VLRIENNQARAGLVGRIKRYAGILNESGATGTHKGAQKGRNYFVSMVDASKAYAQFDRDLYKAVEEGLQGRGHAMAMTAAFFSFSHRSQNKKPVLVDMDDSLSIMKKDLISRADPKELLVWGLVSGQFSSALDFLDREAACEINDRWIADVVSPAQASLTSKELNHFLLGAGGSIPAFMDKTMKPFVTRRANGYHLVTRNGTGVSISPEFLVFINTAISGHRSLELAMKESELQNKKQHLDLVTLRQSLERQDQDNSKKILAMSKKEFPVVLKALPTDVNPGSLAKPFLTKLTLSCARKTYVLNNFNLPVRSSWTWSPLVCGRTTLEIHIGKRVITRSYPGHNGFAHFLEAFYQGALRLSPQDFPLDKDALSNLRISQLVVRFQFAGAHALLSRYRQEQMALASRGKIRDKILKIDSELSILDQNDLDHQKTSLRDRPFASNKIPARIANCFPGEEERSPASPPNPSGNL